MYSKHVDASDDGGDGIASDLCARVNAQPNQSTQQGSKARSAKQSLPP